MYFSCVVWCPDAYHPLPEAVCGSHCPVHWWRSRLPSVECPCGPSAWLLVYHSLSPLMCCICMVEHYRWHSRWRQAGGWRLQNSDTEPPTFPQHSRRRDGGWQACLGDRRRENERERESNRKRESIMEVSGTLEYQNIVLVSQCKVYKCTNSSRLNPYAGIGSKIIDQTLTV